MSSYEYKTVAMPQLVKPRRRRGQTPAQMIAASLGNLIDEHAVDGWEYHNAETLRTLERSNLIGAKIEQIYTVLIFRREDTGTERPAARLQGMRASPAEVSAAAPPLPGSTLDD